MNDNEIFENVCECVRQAGDIGDLEITPDMSIIDDLGMDSIDLVDFTFQLEQMFAIEFPIDEMEERTAQEMGDVPFEIDSVITPEGREHLRKSLPEVPQDKIVEGITVYDLPRLISIESICKAVKEKLKEKSSSVS